MKSTERERFRQAFLDETSWIRVATDLLASASALKPKMMRFWKEADEAMETAKRGGPLRSIPSEGVIGVYFMLVSYGLENLLKAIVVKTHKSELERHLQRSNAVTKSLQTHDLRKLVGLAGVVLDAAEEELLLRLEENATWRGRYPIPLHASKLLNRYLSDGSFASQSWYSASDGERIDAIVGKVRARIAA